MKTTIETNRGMGEKGNGRQLALPCAAWHTQAVGSISAVDALSDYLRDLGDEALIGMRRSQRQFFAFWCQLPRGNYADLGVLFERATKVEQMIESEICWRFEKVVAKRKLAAVQGAETRRGNRSAKMRRAA